MNHVPVYFFGGPYHGRVQTLPKVDDEHLLGAPPEIQLVRHGQLPEFIDGDLHVDVFGAYVRTAELEKGALVYRWEGPEWDMEMEFSTRGGD